MTFPRNNGDISGLGTIESSARIHLREWNRLRLLSATIYKFSLHTMASSLDRNEIEKVLLSCEHAHLGCCDASEPYVVPISYAFQDGAIYGYTHTGRKIAIMRKNPRVCIHVGDYVKGHWRSVILMGTYEELSGESRNAAVSLLSKHINKTDGVLPFLPDDVIPEHSANQRIIYKINITEMTGRSFE